MMLMAVERGSPQFIAAYQAESMTTTMFTSSVSTELVGSTQGVYFTTQLIHPMCVYKRMVHSLISL